ncbi:MAG: hypothetical protein GOV15_01025, partial [Candidatus Diapherotrites archaeon]|nr:hypothetical protein [Candidatus Diapherotrites archaeon]
MKLIAIDPTEYHHVEYTLEKLLELYHAQSGEKTTTFTVKKLSDQAVNFEANISPGNMWDSLQVLQEHGILNLNKKRGLVTIHHPKTARKEFLEKTEETLKLLERPQLRSFYNERKDGKRHRASLPLNFDLLEKLKEGPEIQTQKEISERINVERGAFSLHLIKLETDGKVIQITLSQLGKIRRKGQRKELGLEHLEGNKSATKVVILTETIQQNPEKYKFLAKLLRPDRRKKLKTSTGKTLEALFPEEASKVKPMAVRIVERTETETAKAVTVPEKPTQYEEILDYLLAIREANRQKRLPQPNQINRKELNENVEYILPVSRQGALTTLEKVGIIEKDRKTITLLLKPQEALEKVKKWKAKMAGNRAINREEKSSYQRMLEWMIKQGGKIHKKNVNLALPDYSSQVAHTTTKRLLEVGAITELQNYYYVNPAAVEIVNQHRAENLETMESNPVGSAQQAVIDLFETEPIPMTLPEMSEKTGLHKQVIYNALTTERVQEHIEKGEKGLYKPIGVEHETRSLKLNILNKLPTTRWTSVSELKEAFPEYPEDRFYTALHRYKRELEVEQEEKGWRRISENRKQRLNQLMAIVQQNPALTTADLRNKIDDVLDKPISTHSFDKDLQLLEERNRLIKLKTGTLITLNLGGTKILRHQQHLFDSNAKNHLFIHPQTIQENPEEYSFLKGLFNVDVAPLNQDSLDTIADIYPEVLKSTTYQKNSLLRLVRKSITEHYRPPTLAEAATALKRPENFVENLAEEVIVHAGGRILVGSSPIHLDELLLGDEKARDVDNFMDAYRSNSKHFEYEDLETGEKKTITYRPPTRRELEDAVGDWNKLQRPRNIIRTTEAVHGFNGKLWKPIKAIKMDKALAFYKQHLNNKKQVPIIKTDDFIDHMEIPRGNGPKPPSAVYTTIK